MDFEPFLKELADLFSVNSEDLTEDFQLDVNTNWDSLTIISMIALMDDHFRVEVSGEKLRQCTSLGQVIRLIKESRDADDSF
jgi:acyl carrier protein